MNAVSVMLVAYACISPVEPAGASHTVAYMCAPAKSVSGIHIVAPKPRAVKRKMVSRCDGTAKECRMSRPVCGREFNDWYFNKKEQRRKFHCVKT